MIYILVFTTLLRNDFNSQNSWTNLAFIAQEIVKAINVQKIASGYAVLMNRIPCENMKINYEHQLSHQKFDWSIFNKVNLLGINNFITILWDVLKYKNT